MKHLPSLWHPLPIDKDVGLQQIILKAGLIPSCPRRLVLVEMRNVQGIINVMKFAPFVIAAVGGDIKIFHLKEQCFKR